jgi:hypothetical protein
VSMGNLSPIPSGLLPTTTSRPCSLLLTLLTSTAARRPPRPPPPPPLDVARCAATNSCATADGPHHPALPPSAGPIPPRISAELGGELTGSAGSGGGTPPPTAPIGESGTNDLHRSRLSTGVLDHGGFTPHGGGAGTRGGFTPTTENETRPRRPRFASTTPACGPSTSFSTVVADGARGREGGREGGRRWTVLAGEGRGVGRAWAAAAGSLAAPLASPRRWQLGTGGRKGNGI